ncbi:MAG: corrinoid protein [Deltaproteobacteria bacterium]|nr:corrinoid protein [Deltaproteobacteria bacterium]
MSDCSNLVEKVIEGDWKEIGKLTQDEIDCGTKPEEIISQLQHGMEVVGEKYSTGEYFLPDMMKSARCMSLAFEVLKPVVEGGSFGKLGKVVIGTVKSDMHDIGKNIVTGFLKGVGFEVIDLGADVSEDRFAEEVMRHQPDILGLSSLLTTTMHQIGVVIKKLEETGLRSRVKVIAGGAPVTQKFALSMGADAYAEDGGEAVKICKQLVKQS